MIDVAVIGLGAWGLCVLERTVSRARSGGEQIRVHAIEPCEVGGVAYDAKQPDFLVLNNPCGQLSLYAPPERDEATRADTPTPGYGVGLFEWAQRRGYRWVDGRCVLDGEGTPITSGDYLPRRVMGEYLRWFYETLLAELPANVEFIRYHDAAVDITTEAGNRERIALADGNAVVVDHVVVTSGHTPNLEPSPEPKGVQVRPAYPVSLLDDSPAPGEHVAVSGMGLVAYDIIAALTIGRGGRFRDAGCDRLVYVPSGREPVIELFSRSGVPYCAKSVTGTDSTGDYQPVACTPDAFAAIRGSGVDRMSRRAVDLQGELLPLLFTEMRARYYIQAATIAEGSHGAERVRAALRSAWLDGTFDEATEQLAVEYGSFEPSEHLFAGDGRNYLSSEDYQKQFYAMLSDDMDEALVAAGSPVKAAQEVLRVLRDDIRSIIEFGGLSLESYIDFKHNVKGRVNRLEAGPPVMRSQQLLALLDAGVVSIPFGPSPTVSVDSNGQTVVTSTRLDISYSSTVCAVIRGHLDMPSLAQSASPLLSRLYRLGRLTQLTYGETAVGSVAISDDFHPFDIEGRVQHNISMFGVLTEGARYFTHYIPSPRSRIRAVVDAQRCIDTVVASAID